MAKQVNTHEAKTHFSKLLETVAAGGEVIIAKAGKPVAKLSPIAPKKTMKPGWAGSGAWMADDFDELPADILEAFER